MLQHGELRLGVFAFQVLSANDITMIPVSDADKKRDALTDNPARELADGITGTKQTR